MDRQSTDRVQQPLKPGNTPADAPCTDDPGSDSHPNHVDSQTVGDGTMIVPSNQDPKGLLSRFPSELRMRIFEATIASYVKLQGCFSYDPIVKDPMHFRRPDDEHSPSCPFLELPHFEILQTCRLYRDEALLLPYQVTLFDLGDVRLALNFLRSLNVQALANIRHIRFECRLLSLHTSGRMDWNYPQHWTTFVNFVANVLINLRELQVDLVGWGYEGYLDETGYSEEDVQDLREVLNMRNLWIRSLLRLRRLPLTKVELVLENYGHVNPDKVVEGLRTDFVDVMTKKLLRPEVVLQHKLRLK